MLKTSFRHRYDYHTNSTKSNLICYITWSWAI